MRNDKYHLQVLAFDPAPLLTILVQKGKITPFKRRQNLAVDDVLPAQPTGFCACGCGVLIVAPRRKWATDQCSWFGYAVQSILLGDTKDIGNWLKRQHLLQGKRICCARCGIVPPKGYEVDHILAVALGGAGRWLDNYQLLCHACHVIKTASDRKLISALRKSLKTR